MTKRQKSHNNQPNYENKLLKHAEKVWGKIERIRANQVLDPSGGFMCPGGCDKAVGGCIEHSDPC